MHIEELFKKLDEKSLTEILSFASLKTGLSPDILEKDLFATGIIRKIFTECKENDKIHFKGGTALSKCHRITDRFSEDCDFFVFTGVSNASRTQEVNLNVRTSNEISNFFPKDQTRGTDELLVGKRGGN